jgi:hypothetical protein
MRLLSLLEDERKSCASWYIFIRQSPYVVIMHVQVRTARRKTEADGNVWSSAHTSARCSFSTAIIQCGSFVDLPD